MGTFITNSPERSLKKRLRTLIEKSKELKFLVGFFYFSGVKELYETLKELDTKGELNNGHLKILIGLNVDRTSYALFEYAKALKLFSEEAVKKDLFESLKKAFTSQDVDNQDFYTQVYFFLKLLEEGKLVLKKTKNPNHAKLYLFKFNEELKEVLPNLFITGSSNLTKAGVESQHEFNVEIKDYGFEEAEAYFDRLWAQAVSLKKEDIQKIVHTIKEESLLKEITPFSAYVYLLKTYLELHRSPASLREIERLMIDKDYTPYSYQLEAVAQALATISAHNGVMLADVVGLGKTVIACLVAKALNKRGLVICPPHLIGDENKESGWKKYLEDFKLWDWEVRSVGKLKDVLKFVQRSNDIEVIIIDEAHRFRNEGTESYYYLREICRGRKVILLTATPFNNRPSDIYSLLKLFTIPKKSTIVFDEDLESRFRQYEVLFRKLGYIKNYAYSSDPKKRKRAERYYFEIFGEKKIDLNKVQARTQELASEIRGIIEPVVIRRNRIDLKYYKEEIPISKVEDPKEWFFELTKEQLAFYDKVIETFAPFEPYLINPEKRFTGAIYLPARYEKGISQLSPEELEELKLSPEENFIFVYQQNLYDFMRRLLVKRFESSFGAFKNSVIRFKEIHEIALEFAKKTKKFILDRKLMEDLVSQDEDAIFERLKKHEKDLKEKKVNTKFYKVYDIEKFKDSDLFFKHLESDLKLFEDLELAIEKLDLDKNDPKAKRLIIGIKDFLKDKRKVVIFSEYLDTASYLKPILKKEFGDRVLTAIGNLSKETISAIYKNFDAQHPEQEDKYDILLTTDKLSEGFNLNRAGAVINYDIPWNPVRVIQRVGRINRIGKKVYENIYIINFFPTETGADIVRSREIAQTKMFMIHNVLGEDAKIFDPDEKPQASELYRRLTTYKEDEEESFYSKLRKELETILEKHPDLREELKSMPCRIKVAKPAEKDELLVFVRKGNDLFVARHSYSDRLPKVTSFEEVHESIKAEPDTPRLEWSENFWKSYYLILDKHFEKPYIKKGRGLGEKAYNLLQEIIKIEDPLRPYKKFISDLIEDLRSFSTLSEFTLSKIISWERFLDSPENLVKEIKKLMDELGEDFLDKIQSLRKPEDEEIIIAIENQKKKSLKDDIRN